MTTEAAVENANVYVFCPEEPELTVMAGGGVFKFSNGRLIFPKGAAALGYFQSNQPRFILTDNLERQGLDRTLLQRITAAMARRADAQDPIQVNFDASIILDMMLSRAVEEPRRPLTSAQLLAEAREGKTAAEVLASQRNPLFFEAEKLDEADSALIESAAKAAGDPDELAPAKSPFAS